MSNPDFVKALNNMSVFYRKEIELTQMGFSVLNPAADIITILIAGNFVYEDLLGKDESLVKVSNAIYLLPGWEKSIGAQREYHWAFVDSIAVLESNHDAEHFLRNWRARG
jgi:hypothetical protein